MKPPLRILIQVFQLSSDRDGPAGLGLFKGDEAGDGGVSFEDGDGLSLSCRGGE